MPNTLKAGVLDDYWSALKAGPIWWYMGTQDLRNQFRRSKMGTSWVFIHLVLMALGVGFIYGRLFHQELQFFLPRLLLGVVVWTFMISAIVQGGQAFIVSEGYIKQFTYAKQIYLFRFLVTAFLNFLMGLAVYFLAITGFSLPIEPSLLGALPGIILLLFISLGHLTIMAYWGVRFRDLPPALAGIFQVLFYITPVIFTTEMLDSQNLSFTYQYNPFYYLIEIVRAPLTTHQMPDSTIYMFALGYGFIVWFFALVTMIQFDSKVAYWL